MKRTFLEGLGLEKEVIESIMKEHGKSIQGAKPEDYDSLKSQATLDSDEIARLNKEIEDYKAAGVDSTDIKLELEKYKYDALKLKVARENNIPFDLTHRLVGETEEELVADAQALSTLVSRQNVLPLKEQSDSTLEDEEYRELLKDLNN